MMWTAEPLPIEGFSCVFYKLFGAGFYLHD
jgi:hypothetical protein